MEKQQFKSKLDNFWYYYKWHVIGGAFLLFCVVFFARDVLMKEKFDITVLAVTKQTIFREQVDELETQFEQYASDIDGNGEINVHVEAITIPKNTQNSDPQLAMAMQAKFIAMLQDFGNVIFLMDDTIREEQDVDQACVDLLPEYQDIPGVEQKKIDVKNTDVMDGAFYLQELPDGLYLSLRENHYDEKDGKKYQNYLRQQEFFDNVLRGNKLHPRADAQ